MRERKGRRREVRGKEIEKREEGRVKERNGGRREKEKNKNRERDPAPNKVHAEGDLALTGQQVGEVVQGCLRLVGGE